MLRKVSFLLVSRPGKFLTEFMIPKKQSVDIKTPRICLKIFVKYCNRSENLKNNLK